MMTIRKKMMFNSIGAFTLILFILAFTLFIVIKKNINEKIKSDLESIANTSLNMLDSSLTDSVQNYLRGIAEKNRQLAEYYYALFQSGKMKEEEAYQKFREILLNPVYGKIGETGYLAGVGTDG
ncbi:MAG TPA: hypothetical protein DHW82_12280, partial [Spirochaetia bacterium]|nr:hypothetical protein [Spirochaetia bacterium]